MSIAIGGKDVKGATATGNLTTSGVTTQATGSTFIIGVAASGAAGVTVPTPTDNKGNTYTAIAARVGMTADDGATRWFIKENGAGGAGHTITVTGADFYAIWFIEITSGVLSGITDQAPAGSHDTATPFTSLTTGTTAQANELVLAFVVPATPTGTDTFTFGNSFSEVAGCNIHNADASWTGAMASRIVSATGTFQSTFTATSTGTAPNEAISFIATFKALIAADNPPPLRTQRAREEIEEEWRGNRPRVPILPTPDQPGLYSWVTDEPEPAEERRANRPRFPWPSVAAPAALVPSNRARAVDDALIEERVSVRRGFPSSVDRPPLLARRAPREELEEEPLRRRHVQAQSVDRPPVRTARRPDDEQAEERVKARAQLVPQAAAVVSQPPPRRQLRTEEPDPEETIRRRFVPLPSGAVAPVDQPPRMTQRARTEEQPEERIPGRPSIVQPAIASAPPPGLRAQRRDEPDAEEPRARRTVQLQSVDGPPPALRAQRREEPEPEDARARRAVLLQSVDAPPPRRVQPREEPEPEETRARAQHTAQAQVLGQFTPTPRRRAAEDLDEERVPQRARLTPPSVAPAPVDNPPLRVQARPRDELADEYAHMFAQGGAIASGSIVLPMPPPDRRASAPVHSRKAFR